MIKKLLLKYPSKIAIYFILISVTFLNFSHHNWLKTDKVIEWDVKSYYAYLPAVFIYKDLSLQFRKDNISKFGDLIWPIETPTGKQAIITTMGMSVLYAPFFGIAHSYCLLTDSFEADGYSMPYRLALSFSTLIYAIIGLFFLRKILKKFFTEDIVLIVILAIGIGTNLLFYYSYSPPMPHAFNFTLITIFLYQIIHFYENPTISKALFIGLISGLITLIRPTNILVLFVLLLWDISSFNEFKNRIIFYLHRYKLVIVMILAFFIIWVPQFVYWYQVSGKIFYFSYGEAGGKFFFDNPQIYNVLVSYKKGWFVYTPIMFIATLGIFTLPKLKKGLFLPIFIFTVFNIFIISSWWCWWYGGSFGQRAFIDSYGLMALPLGAAIQWVKSKKLSYYFSVFIITILIVFNNFQIQQFTNNAIHYWWMNKEAYWETFLKLRPTEKYYQVITIPDYEKARQGIYEEIKSEHKKTEKINIIPSKAEVITYITSEIRKDSVFYKSICNIETDSTTIDSVLVAESIKIYHIDSFIYYKKMVLLNLEKDIRNNNLLMESIAAKAKKNKISVDSMVTLDAIWLFNKNDY